MKNAIIKNISMYMAFVQLFCSGLLYKNNNDIKPKTSSVEYVLVDNTNTPIYQKVNTETGEQSVISIFDDENIPSKQYGANQRVFKNNFEELIQDPVIWEEMQKYYPVENFECMDDAMFFYRGYFYIIYDSGCGCAAAADFVFKLYEGHEDEFCKDFGYPMYVYREGKIDFNYETFMLKFFNFYNLEMREDYESIDKWTKKDLIEHQLFRIAADTEFRKQYKDRELTDDEYAELNRIEDERQERLKELRIKYRATRKERVNMGITLDGAFGYLYVYLGRCGIQLDTSWNVNRDIDENDIVACDKVFLYRINKDGEVGDREDCIGWHYVYVTENNDKQIVVSSWGNKYIYDPSIANEMEYIRLNAH